MQNLSENEKDISQTPITKPFVPIKDRRPEYEFFDLS